MDGPLTDLPKSGDAMAPPVPQGTTSHLQNAKTKKNEKDLKDLK